MHCVGIGIRIEMPTVRLRGQARTFKILTHQIFISLKTEVHVSLKIKRVFPRDRNLSNNWLQKLNGTSLKPNTYITVFGATARSNKSYKQTLGGGGGGGGGYFSM